MSSMLLISRRLNPNFESYTDCVNFGNVWKQYLMSVPWADFGDLMDCLRRENAILLPIYILHYEQEDIEGQFKVFSHPYPMNGHKYGADVTKIRELFSSLGLDFSIIERNSLQLPLNFHDDHYMGHAVQFKNLSPVPECIKHMVDSSMSSAYRPRSPNFKFSNEDWCVQLNLRIDNVFSTDMIKVTLVTSMFDNAALTEIPPFWPIDPLHAGNSPHSRYDSVLNCYNDKLETLFIGQKTVLRRYLDYSPSSEYEEAQSFLNSDHLPINFI